MWSTFATTLLPLSQSRGVMALMHVCCAIPLVLLWGLAVEADTVHLCYTTTGP